jgi:hypothetical protein
LCSGVKASTHLEGASREFLVAVLAVGAPARTGVAQVVLHEDARDHRTALRCAEHRIVLACIQMRLHMQSYKLELRIAPFDRYGRISHL